DPIVRADVPLLARVLPFVGHAPTRARGTIGGSLANADPAAEIGLVAVTLGATLSYREGGATAEIPAAGFFQGPMKTGPFPPPPPPAPPRCASQSGARRTSALASTRSMPAAATSPLPRHRRSSPSTATASASAWLSASAR